MSVASDPAPVEAGLLIRVWVEPDSTGQLRARVLTLSGDLAEQPLNWATATGEAGILAAVQQWLQHRHATLAGSL